MKKILMSCGIQGDKGVELDRGSVYMVGVHLSDELATELVRTGRACSIPEIDEVPAVELMSESSTDPKPSESYRKGAKNARS